MARKFSDTVKEDKDRAKNRANALFEKKPGPKPKGPETGRLLLDRTAAGANGPSFKDLKHHFDNIKGLKARVKDASDTLSQAKKRAKECGVNTTVLDHLMKLEKQDPLEVRMYFQQLDRAAQATGVEVQIDLFDSSGLSREAQIFDDGVRAGLAAKSTADNPHNPSIDAGQTWLAGWHAGQRRNAAGIGQS